MEKLLIIGAGGHCTAALDQILALRQYEVCGILDQCDESHVLGVPILGGDEMMEPLFQSGVRCGFVAIGNNAIRKKLITKMEQIGFEMVTIISPKAVVSPFAAVEMGSLVMPGAIINAGAHIGKGCILNTNCSVDHECVIGECVHIAPGCAISGKVRIGAGSFIGTGARIIDGITIGENVMLGAGAVAIRNIPGNCTAVGVPARVIK